MAIGEPGADSSTVVTHQIGGRNLIDLATETFGKPPLFWGRYFTSSTTAGDVEYRAHKESQILRDNNIRVLPIARQTNRVDGSQANGTADGQSNAADVLFTFGRQYLADQGGRFLMFLDVEGSPSLSLDYYIGWATALSVHSLSLSNGAVRLQPCVYATQGDTITWEAIRSAQDQGVECAGVWVARWRHRGCLGSLEWDDGLVLPEVPLACPVLLWQYSDECHGGLGYDCNQANPKLDLQFDLLNRLILPSSLQ